MFNTKCHSTTVVFKIYYKLFKYYLKLIWCPEANLRLLQHPRWSALEPLTIITKRSILDVAAVLDPHLVSNIETEIYGVKIFF